MENYKVSSRIGDAIPSFIRDDYSRFVNFIQDIYKSDERRGSSMDLLRNILSYKDFTSLDGLNYSSTTLSVSIGPDDTEIELEDASSLPDQNGVIKINNEIILYKKRVNNTLFDCLRGSSYVTKLNSIYEKSTYTFSEKSEHISGSIVEDLTILVLSEILGKTYKTFSPTISPEIVDSSIQRSIILSRISSFYKSKGSVDGIRVLFKLVYGNVDIDVLYPGDQVLRCSDSSWVDKNLIKCELISGNIESLYDNVLYNSLDFNDTNSIVCLVEDFYRIPQRDDYIYEILINSNYKNLEFCPKTVLKCPVTSSDRIITVESTYGFPDINGKIYLNNEEINYSYKTSNQFFECVRNSPIDHTSGNVFGDKFLYVQKNGEVTTLRLLGLMTDSYIKNGGLFNSTGDIEIENSGVSVINEPVINNWIENTNCEFAKNYDSTIANISKFTRGINSIHFDDDYVFVQSSSLPSTVVGPFGSAGAEQLQPLVAHCKFPRKPKTSTTNLKVGSESIGMFVDGVLAQSNYVDEKLTIGGIKSISVTSSGSGYINPPVVIIEHAEGSGATATATVSDGKVTSITVNTAGSNYKLVPEPPVVRLSSGEGAILEPTIDPYGKIILVSVEFGGRYYTNIPNLVVVDPTGKGRGALLSFNSGGIVNGVIQSNSIRIIDAGIDYSPQSYILVEPVGKDATATAEVFSYTKTSQSYVTGNTTFSFDPAGGFVYPRSVELSSVRNTYCYNSNPISLRNILNDNGVNHSPLLGYAFDGNPIYGPYGYSEPNNVNSSIIRMTSSYQLRSRPGANPPSLSLYPIGSFIEDYLFVENSGTLDKHNGRYCVTPEYPNGTYAYFITLNDNQEPVYPYIIGPTFKSIPVSQDVDFLGEKFDRLNTTTKNFYKEIVRSFYDYSNVVRRRNSNLSQSNQSIEALVSKTSLGGIQGVYVDASDDNYAVGDICNFDYTDNKGFGCEAKVSWIVGEEISTLSLAIQNVRVYSNQQQINLSLIDSESFQSNDISLTNNYIIFDTVHEFVTGTRVLFTNVSGNIPDGLVDNRYYYVKVINSTTIQLFATLRNLSENLPVEIKSQGTGDKLLTPVYSFTVGKVIVTQNGSEFTVTGWDPITNILDIKILNQVVLTPNDKFKDNVGATVYVPVNSIVLPTIPPTATEIPVTNSFNFKNGDIVQIGPELMTVVSATSNGILNVIRDPETAVTIQNNKNVINLTRFALFVTTVNKHNLSLGDVIEVVGAIPEFINGKVVVEDIINDRTIICTKTLSELDSNDVFQSASEPEGYAYTTDTSPYYSTSITSGKLWWSPFTGILYIYYVDQDSGQWVNAIPTGVLSNHLGEYTTPVPTSGNPPTDSILISGDVIQIRQIAPTVRKNGQPLKSGDLWWSSVTGQLHVYYKKNWVVATPNGVVPRESEGAYENIFTNYPVETPVERESEVTISNIPPNNPLDGDLWWSSTSGFLYVRYNSRWVVATPVGRTPTEGASSTPISNSNLSNVNYSIILVADGDYFYATNSTSAVGKIYKIDVTSAGYNLDKLPIINGVYPRILDRCQLLPYVNSNGNITDITVVTGGNRYNKPKILFLSETGSGATANVITSNGVITDVNITNSGQNYSLDNLQLLIIETGNNLVPISDSIGKIDSIRFNRVGYYQNSDPTIVSNFKVDINCTIINFTGNFSVGQIVSSDSGKFTGTISKWEKDRKVLTITNYTGFVSDNDILTTSTGSGKVLQSGQSHVIGRIKPVSNMNGQYVTSKSIISSSYQKITDSYYYQDFSYVINSNIQLNDYKKIIKDNVHPSGFVLFGKLQLVNLVNVIQPIVESEVVLD